MNRELVTGLAQLSAEKGLPKEVVSDIIARAIKRAYGDEEHIDVKVDVQTGAFKVFLLKTVVEKVEDPKIQVQLDTAKKIKPDAQLGDVIPFEESAAALGRIGAQTAKQVIQQSLREAEREQVFAEYADREGESSMPRSATSTPARRSWSSTAGRRRSCRAPSRLRTNGTSRGRRARSWCSRSVARSADRRSS